MKILLASLAITFALTGLAHAQEPVSVPVKNVATETVVEKREVRTVKRTGPARVHRVRCKDGSVHRNVRGACRTHGGAQKRYWTRS